MNPLAQIDKFLNRLTMYRLVVYGLSLLAAVALGLSLAGALAQPAMGLLISLATLLIACYVTGRIFAILWDAPANSESALITGLILFFVLPPATTLTTVILLALAGLLAMLSKYLLAWRHQHIFNPAAIALVIMNLTGTLYASWWVGGYAMLPFTLILGLLVVRKVRRFSLTLSFWLASLMMMLAVGISHGRTPVDILLTALISWPIIFFGTIMLTEPATTPPGPRQQLILGLLVGGLFASQLRLGPLHTTPEVVLALGNIYAFIVSPKARLRLKLKSKTQLSAHVYDLTFTPDRPLDYQAGQYLEWTLPHRHTDGRGNRRTFTLASSPTEPELRIGIKTYNPSSSFKTALLALQPGETIAAGRLAGHFTLPADTTRPLGFIAGGIGITPMRSMIKYLIDTDQKRDIVLFYIVSDPAELSYQDILTTAASHGVKLVPVLHAAQPSPDWTGPTGPLTPELIQQFAPNYRQRDFYLSGPQAMVDHYRDQLRHLGLSRRQLHTDHFSGY